MKNIVLIVDYSSEYRPAIRRILESIGWVEQYITASEHNADFFSENSEEDSLDGVTYQFFEPK